MSPCRPCRHADHTHNADHRDSDEHGHCAEHADSADHGGNDDRRDSGYNGEPVLHVKTA